MRFELEPLNHAGRQVVLVRVYSRAGELLGSGSGDTEEGARYNATLNWANRAAIADEQRVERRRKVRACVCDVGVVPAPWDEDECYKCGGC